MSESAQNPLADSGGSAWSVGGGQELFGLLSPWDPLHTHTHTLHVLWMGLVNISRAISICLLLGLWGCGCEVPLSSLGVAFLAGSVRLLPMCCREPAAGFGFGF